MVPAVFFISKSVGKLVPQTVGVFCTLLEPPKCNIMQQIYISAIFVFWGSS